MTKSELIVWLKHKGFTQDRWGHYKKTVGEYVHRIKLQKKSIRYEVKKQSLTKWTRLRSGYYSQLSISENDKLKGMKK